MKHKGYTYYTPTPGIVFPTKNAIIARRSIAVVARSGTNASSGPVFFRFATYLFSGNIATKGLGLEPVEDDEDTVAGWRKKKVSLCGRQDATRKYSLLKHMER